MVDGVRHGRHVLARVRLAGRVELVVPVLGVQHEELHQGCVQVPGDGRLVGAVALFVAGEAVPRAHRIVHVQHGQRCRPRVLVWQQIAGLVHRERAVLVEHRVQATGARASLQPQHDGRVRLSVGGREEPEEHVGTVLLVHGQVTGATFGRAVVKVHFALCARLVNPTVAYHWRQVKGLVDSRRTTVVLYDGEQHDGDEQRDDDDADRRDGGPPPLRLFLLHDGHDDHCRCRRAVTGPV